MMFREFKPETARDKKPTDQFFAQAAGVNSYGQRQYTILNTGRAKASAYTVTFMRSTTGVKLAHCTCPDFQINLQQCKHLRPCAALHVAIMRALRAVEGEPRTRSAARMAIMPTAAATV